MSSSGSIPRGSVVASERSYRMSLLLSVVHLLASHDNPAGVADEIPVLVVALYVALMLQEETLDARCSHLSLPVVA